MDRLFFSLLALALQWFRPRYNAQLQLLAAQIRILRSRIDVTRIVPTPKEKAERLRLGRTRLDRPVARPRCSVMTWPRSCTWFSRRLTRLHSNDVGPPL
jgi:hypothetical protein